MPPRSLVRIPQIWNNNLSVQLFLSKGLTYALFALLEKQKELVYGNIFFRSVEVVMIMRNACPRCGCDLHRGEDEFGEYMFCKNLYWLNNRAMRGCMWLGNVEEFMREEEGHF
jgi:hypothetical protein